MPPERGNTALKRRQRGAQKSAGAPLSPALSGLLDQAARQQSSGDLTGAKASLCEILQRAPRHAPSLLALGNITAQFGHYDQAINLFARAADADPTSPVYHAQMGRALQACGRLDDAVIAVKQAITRDDGVAELFFLLGNLHSQRGGYDDAIIAYTTALQRRPGFAQANCNLGAAYRETGKLHDALHAYRRAIDIDPSLAIAHANLGAALTELGECEAAIESCRRATELAPKSVQGYANLGVALREAGQSEQAILAFRQALTIDPKFVDGHVNLGNALRSLARIEDAYACYQQVAKLDPDNTQAHSSQASVLLEMGKPKEALEVCDQYLTRNPYNSLLQAARIATLRTLRDHEQLASLTDLEQLIFAKKLLAPTGYADIQAFNEALSRHVLSHRSLAHAPTSHATRQGQHTGELLATPRGPMDDFEQLARAAMAEFLSSRSLPYLQAPSATIRMNVWGVVMGEGGHQVPHIHPTAWISGVYYPKLPDKWITKCNSGESNSGWIEFGRLGREFPCSVEPVVRMVRPEEGLMLLFPSYLYHRTIPLDTHEHRVSIAFDYTREG